MKEYKVYKKVRLRATIMGMPTINFWVMVIVDALVLLVLTTGLSILKVIFVLVALLASYILARFIFNLELLNNTRIKDYRRNAQ